MKTGFLITARLKSTRLPEKLLQPISGRAALAHLVDRAKRVRSASVVVVCTSTNPEDDRLEALARAEGIECFRGHDDDVLQRLHDAARAFGLDYILNITADCPLVDPDYADRIADASREGRADLIRAMELPHGAYSYGLAPEALATVLAMKDDVRTEVWGRYFTDTDAFTVRDLPVDPEHRRPDLRMTLDYPEDLTFFRAVFDRLYRPGEVFTLDHVLALLDAEPDLIEFNRHCESPYRTRLARQAAIRLKPRHHVRRVAVIGCGSIGRRHLRNLATLGVTELVALRSGLGAPLDPSWGVREVTTWEELEAAAPDAAVIATPTRLHLDAARRLVPFVRGLFIEKPLSDSLDGVPQLLEDIRQHRTVSFIGFNLQFHRIVRALTEELANEPLGRPLVLQGQVGYWLPDWHPDEDYQRSYAARRDLGGGVALTLIHEIHLALELFGPARAVACLMPPSSALPLDVEVIADLMMQHESGTVSQLHLDYLQRPLHREGVVSCERGWLQFDLAQPRLVRQQENNGSTQVVVDAPDYDPNETYLEEMRMFLRYVAEGRTRHPWDVWRAARSLAVVDAAKASARDGIFVKLSEEVGAIA